MQAFVSAFLNSARGLRLAARGERAVRQELLVFAVALPLAAVLSDQMWTRIALIGVLMLVVCVELLNTAIEKLSDHVTREHHPAIGAIKDMASAAVLCTLLLAGMVWGAAAIDAMDHALR